MTKRHLQPDAEAATSGTVQRLQERIAELERERDEDHAILRAWLSSECGRSGEIKHPIGAAIAKGRIFRSERDDLRAQLAEAQADSERLDAVQKQFDDQVAKDHGLGGDFRIWFWFSHQHGLYWHWAIESPESHFPTVREAIDAAARKDEESDAQAREDFVGLVDPETEELP